MGIFSFVGELFQHHTPDGAHTGDVYLTNAQDIADYKQILDESGAKIIGVIPEQDAGILLSGHTIPQTTIVEEHSDFDSMYYL